MSARLTQLVGWGSGVPVLQQSFCGDVVVPALLVGDVPPHRVSETIVDIEQKRDLQRLGDRRFRDAFCEDGAHIVGAETLVSEGHLFKKTQHRTQSFVDRRAGIVVEDLLREMIVVKSGRRDRGVGVRSKGTFVHA